MAGCAAEKRRLAARQTSPMKSWITLLRQDLWSPLGCTCFDSAQSRHTRGFFFFPFFPFYPEALGTERPSGCDPARCRPLDWGGGGSEEEEAARRQIQLPDPRLRQGAEVTTSLFCVKVSQDGVRRRRKSSEEEQSRGQPAVDRPGQARGG